MSAPREEIPPITLHRRMDRDWATPGGLRSLTAVNHSVLGKRFMLTGFFFFLVGGVLAMLIRAQLATPNNAFLDSEAYNQIFTMHGTVMMFLFAIPVLEGFAIYLLPKLLGARDLAFPRLTAFAYWCYLFGGMILLGGLLAGVAPDSGWFMYTPLSGAEFTPGVNADIWLLGVTFVEISAIAAGVELTASVLKIRTAGMSLRRMPLFGWYILVTAVMILAGFPPLILGSILLELERAFGWPFFEVAGGGDPLLWQHLFWLFGHPEVYIIFLPAAGIVSTLIPVFARHPIVGYSWIVASIVATGFISFGLWVHHMFTVGIPHLALAFFSAASMLVAVPTAIQFFAWIATLWAGRPRLRLPMLYLFGFLFVFVAGGLTGVMLALVPFNWQVHDTHFVVAHLHYVLVGGLVFPLLAGAYYWMPLFTGRMPSERLGHWAFWLIFIGFNLTFFLMHLTGLLGMPRRIYTYPEGLGWEWLNLLSSVGGFIMSAGFALFLLDLIVHGRYGRPAPRNPWDAGTLEWAMATPPPSYNIAAQPRVDSREPLQDQPGLENRLAAGEGLLGTPRPGCRETLGVETVSGEPEYVLRLPGPSWLPLLGGLSMALFFLAFLAGQYPLSAVSLLLMLLVALRWAWNQPLQAAPKPVDAGQGLHLPGHHSVAGAPGWWGVCLLLVADGALFASLLFGYLFLWAVAPGWPPPELVDGGQAYSLIALAGALAVCLLLRPPATGTLGPENAADYPLLPAALAGLISLTACITGLVSVIPDPASHAYAAVSTVLAGYIGFHLLVGVIMLGQMLVKRRAGRLAVSGTLERRIVRAWWLYSLTTAVAGLALLHGLPLATGAA